MTLPSFTPPVYDDVAGAAHRLKGMAHRTPVLPSGAQLCQLDVQLSSPLPPLGVVHRREQIPAMLIRMLKSWRTK